MPSKVVTQLDLVKEFPRGGSGVYAIAFSPDGQQFAIAFYDMNLVLNSAQDHKTLWKKKGSRGVRHGIAFSPDGKLIATCGPCDDRNDKLGGQVLIWDAATGKLLRTVDSKRPEEDAWQIAFLPDGSSAVCLLNVPGESARIALVKASTGKLTTFLDADDSLNCFAVSPLGDELAVGRDNSVEFYTLKTGKRRKQVPLPAETNAITYSPDGKLVAASNRARGVISIVETKSGKIAKSIKHVKQDLDSAVHSLLFAPEAGELIAVHGRGGLYAFDLKTGKQTAAFQVPVTTPHINHSAAIHLTTGLYADAGAKARLWRLR
jgi:WD40 repeat protein